MQQQERLGLLMSRAPLVTLMQRASLVSRLWGSSSRPLARSELEAMTCADQERARLAVDALLAGRFLEDCGGSRIRSRRAFERRPVS
jgi:hypothetical protein